MTTRKPPVKGKSGATKVPTLPKTPGPSTTPIPTPTPAPKQKLAKGGMVKGKKKAC